MNELRRQLAEARQRIRELEEELAETNQGLVALTMELEQRVEQRTEALQASEERYRTLFDSLIEGYCTIEMVFDTDCRPVDYRFLDINPAFEKQTGLHNAQGHLIRELVPNHEAHWFEVYGRVAVTGEPAHFEHEAKSLGHYYDVQAFRLGGPESRKVAILFNDIAARKRAEEALRQAADELARSNKDLERFAYVASHDLQEPLRSVSGFVKLLKDRYQGKLDAKADEYIGFTVEGVSRMQAMIKDLLDYARAGTQGKALVPTDMQMPLRRALANLRLSIEESGAVIKRDELPTVNGDPAQLTQLFQNLIGNAIKFRGDRKPEIRVGATCHDQEWLFSIRDNGIGLDVAQSERIFQIFQRLHAGEKYSGTGIGLAICKKIVERHGGRIWVDSQLGEGSTFYFTLSAGPTT
jgi:PAS domain S-box-containing protein